MDKEFNEVEVWGITSTQALILSLLTDPSRFRAFISEHKCMTRQTVAKFLGLRYIDVVQAFNKELASALYQECIVSMRHQKALIDQALVISASNPTNYGNADRKLYYELIGELNKKDRNRQDDSPGSKDEKIELVTEYLSKFLGYQVRKDLLDDRDARRAGRKRNGGDEGRSEDTPKEESGGTSE